MRVLQEKLRGHVVLCGYGVSGAEAVRELVRRGTDPGRIVVIDQSDSAIAAAERCGTVVLDGDATHNHTLEAVRVAEAKAIIVAAGRDDTSILIVLTARRLAPGVPISVVIRAHDNEPLAQQAGADTVINPASFAGLLLAGSTGGPHIADYMMDLAASDGAVQLRERVVTDEEVGRPLSAIATGVGLRVYRRGEPHGCWSDEVARLERGDLIVEVVRGAAPERRPAVPAGTA